MQKTRVLIHLVEPINDRNGESAFWLYEKCKSVMCGCKTIKQLANANTWACNVMLYLCPRYSELYIKLHNLFWELYENIVKQKEQ
jgi:hypothetical protein